MHNLQTDKIAVISDIHGNAWALDKVLQDITDRGIRRIVNLGDVFYGPLDPEGTAKLLRDFAIATVLGNQDRILCRPRPAAQHPTLAFVLKVLPTEARDWLQQLPKTLVLKNTILACHGTPADDSRYLVEDISSGRPILRADDDLCALLHDVPHALTLCGHSHLAWTVRTCDGKWIINPGSVGLPAFDDDTPLPHKMESASPHACYAILASNPPATRVEHIRIPYDWQNAAAAAVKNGRDDWARWLRTGRA